MKRLGFFAVSIRNLDRRESFPVVFQIVIYSKMVHYLVDSEIGFDEDDEHEFKSHRTICADEVPAWAVFEENNKLKRSRQPISK